MEPRITKAVTIASPYCSGKSTGRLGDIERRRRRRRPRGAIVTLYGVQEAFGIVIFVVMGVAVVVAIATLAGRGKLYDQIGRGGLRDDRDAPAQEPAAGSAAAAGVRDEEIRQMIGAQNARRARRGQAPLDVEEEIKRLHQPRADPALREEVRQLVLARNARRERQGKPPLDVEEEVARQLRDLE